MSEATRMKEIAAAARAGEYCEDYRGALCKIEEAARTGRGAMTFEYVDDEKRKGVSALLKAEGFHTVRIGPSQLFVRWDHQ